MYFLISEYAELLKKNGIVTDYKITEDVPVKYISYNSSDIMENTLFVCKGAHFKEEYLYSALEKGASVYVSEKKYETDGSYIIINDVRKALPLIANFYYENIWEKLNVIGITGTKGKSTTTYFLKTIIDEYMKHEGKPESAVISSIDTYDGVIFEESHLTTPEPFELHKHYSNAVKSGISHLTMEVSSQALKYGRVGGVTFDVACYLNIGDDHISDVEHKDFDDYFYSKMMIFGQAKTACINLDSDHSDKVVECAKNCPNVISFSTKDETADVYGYNIHKVNNDTVFNVKTKDFDEEFTLTIPGLFNVENALAAISISIALEIPQKFMYVGLMKARSSGRMEVYSNANSDVTVIVDYAHNKMSFENLFASVLKEFPGREIYTVFGCPGKKAFQRRKDLGEVSGRYSNKVFLTEEDAGEEPLIDICKEIAVHVANQECDYEIEPDRGEAIRKAIFAVKEKSIVLITGKGNETRQKRGIEYIPCPSDVEYTKKFLKEYDVENKIDCFEKIQTIQDIMPSLYKLHGKTVFIKLGGSVMEDDKLTEGLIEDISMLKMVGAKIVIVHGGGKKISRTLSAMNIETEFVDGYRVTDENSIEVVEMVLSGNVNKKIVQGLKNKNLPAVGISGKDAGILVADKKLSGGKDIGLVGEVKKVNTELISILLEKDYIVVLSPVGSDEGGNTLNINADDAAFAVAEEMKADKMIFITDVDGIYLDINNTNTLVEYISLEKAEMMIENDFVGGGMIPKLKNCIKAIKNGVNEVTILNGTVKNNLVSAFVSQKKPGTTIGKGSF